MSTPALTLSEWTKRKAATETEAQQEYEAEQWTISTMRREGLCVPDHILEDMRRYVASCVKSSRGHAIPRRVRRFIR